MKRSLLVLRICIVVALVCTSAFVWAEGQGEQDGAALQPVDSRDEDSGELEQQAAARSAQVEVRGWDYVVATSEEMVDTRRFQRVGPYTIGYATIFMANSWSAQLKHEIEAEAATQGAVVDRIVHIDAELETANQISAVEDMIARGVDAIVIDPISPTALSGVFQRARESGIPVIAISSPIPQEQVTAWVGRDDAEYGAVTARWLAETLGGRGNVVALSGIAGNPVAERRWEGANGVFERYPEIRIVTREFADWGFAQAKSAVANVLAAYPEIDAVWSGGGAMTQGAMEAFSDARREMVPMVGEANNGFLLDWIESSDAGFSGIAFNNPTSHSAIGLRLALMALRGQPIPKSVDVTGPYIFTLDDARRHAREDLEDGYWVGHTLTEEALEELWGR